MNTLEAFKEMININGMDKTLQINHSTFHSYRRRINKGKEVSYKTMEKLLLKAGWENKGWIKPKVKYNHTFNFSLSNF